MLFRQTAKDKSCFLDKAGRRFSIEQFILRHISPPPLSQVLRPGLGLQLGRLYLRRIGPPLSHKC
eukprot:6214387-Pleurochrysis_carterae.AAC.1